MDPTSGIVFHEISSNPDDFLSDLVDADLRKARNLSPAAVCALRRHQVARLEGNVAFLQKKQEEFNRRMEEYIQSIRALIGSVERSLDAEGIHGRRPAAKARGGTRAHCVSCGAATVFRDLHVIAGRDSLESLGEPAGLIVDDAGALKKGSFSCPRCGSGSILIRDLG